MSSIPAAAAGAPAAHLQSTVGSAGKPSVLGLFPVEVRCILVEFSSEETATALMRTDNAGREVLRASNACRNTLLRFAKGRVAASAPHPSGRYVLPEERQILLQTTLDLDLSNIRLNQTRIARLVHHFQGTIAIKAPGAKTATPLPRIIGLRLDNCSVDDRMTQALLPLKDTLQHLSCANDLFKPCGHVPTLSNEGVKTVATFAALQRLVISGDDVRTDGLQALANLRALNSLTLSNGEGRIAAITKDLIELYAKNIPNLRTVTIQNWSITTQALEALSSMRSLEELTLNCPGKLSSSLSSSSASCKNLKKLYVADTPLNRTWGENLLKERGALRQADLKKYSDLPDDSSVKIDAIAQWKDLEVIFVAKSKAPQKPKARVIPADPKEVTAVDSDSDTDELMCAKDKKVVAVITARTTSLAHAVRAFFAKMNMS